MSIPQEEWLDAAKRLAVGTKARIRHRFESRENLMIFNNADSWSCWCFACNEGGKVHKQHPVLLPEATPGKGSALPLPDDCVPLQRASEALQRTSYAYLLIRGIDPDRLLQGMDVLVSPKVMRLCLEQQGNAYVGRGIANQKVKAMTYSEGKAPTFAIHPQDSEDFTGRHVVLLEDYLSTLKVRFADPSVQAVSVQGSSINAVLVAKLLKAARVSIMLDGDPAGIKGAQKIFRSISGLIRNTRIISTPTGKDPKNLSVQTIRSLLNGNDV